MRVPSIPILSDLEIGLQMVGDRVVGVSLSLTSWSVLNILSPHHGDYNVVRYATVGARRVHRDSVLDCIESAVAAT